MATPDAMNPRAVGLGGRANAAQRGTSGPGVQVGGSRRSEAPAFTLALETAMGREGIQLSKHARERMAARRIELDGDDVERIGRAMTELQSKGGGVSLLMMGDTALVTNVKNRTVITAIDTYSSNEKMFTNIDSAVFIDRA